MNTLSRIKWIVLPLGLALAGCTGTAEQKTAGEYVDDAVITGKVKAAIIEEKAVDANDINVETYKGVVQLSGFIDNEDQRWKAVEAARRVDGVKSVRESLIVKGS